MKKFRSIVLVVVVFVLSACYINILIKHNQTDFLCSDLEECQYGKELKIEIDTVSIDTIFKIPTGQLAFAHTHDYGVVPVLMKLDSEGRVQWAVQLIDEQHDCGDIGLYQMSNLFWSNVISDYTIRFSCYSATRVGYVNLTNDYNFACVSFEYM